MSEKPNDRPTELQDPPMATTGKATWSEPRHATDRVDICRLHASRAEHVADRVIVEQPLTIMVDRVGSFTVMCTPSDVEALAVGFIYSEGMIGSAAEVTTVLTKDDVPNVVGLEIERPAQFGIARNLVVASSCGMCGVRNIEKLLANVPVCGESLNVSERLLPELIERLRSIQDTFELTGSSHAAALFDREGELVAWAEDIGRHNAMDKAIGKCLLAGRVPRGCGAVLSGRISLEIVTKAARAGIELIVSVSGVSSYAVTAAQRWNITLCGFVRQGKVNIYTHPARIVLENHGRYAHEK
jgi:FdhD protein